MGYVIFAIVFCPQLIGERIAKIHKSYIIKMNKYRERKEIQ